MYRHIMIPLDGSRTAEMALAPAAELARKADAMLHLVRVVDWIAELTDESDRDSPTRYFRRVADRISRKYGIEVRYELLSDAIDTIDYGPPPRRAIAKVLTTYVEDHRIDLTVLSSHGRGGFKRMWLGSVADSMLRIPGQSILLVPRAKQTRRNARFQIKRVLVPVDTSQLQEEAVARAVEMGEYFDAEYLLLHIAIPSSVLVPAGAAESAHAAEEEAAAGTQLHRLAMGLASTGHRVHANAITEPFVASAILRYAIAQQADLIAIATRGTGRVERALFGSVADKVVRGAHVPVLACNLHDT